MVDGRFVCAINRNRDNYQVPLALYEAGLLSTFVTDYYAPDRPPSWLPAPMRRRHIAGLPARVTHNAVESFTIQSAAEILKLPMHRIFAITDYLLGRKAGRVAHRTDAHLYCYSPYLPPEKMIARGVRRAIFEYHPLPELFWRLIDEDFARYPYVAWSYEMEKRAFEGSRNSDTWRRADAVSCASSITRQSLIHAGCDPSIVKVVPYGFDVAPIHNDISFKREKTCKFLFVGQGVQRKGLHHLIDAWQESDLADAQLTLVCYRIDPGIRDRIKSSSITLLGRQSKAELDALYQCSDVFVMPSLIEGFGLVYLEALSRGCHVIGTENTGLPDLPLSPEVATILPLADKAALAAALAAARNRANAGSLDRAAIKAAAHQWRWADFRAGIADHARSVLAA